MAVYHFDFFSPHEVRPRLWPTSRLFCLDSDVNKTEGESYGSWLALLNVSCRKFCLLFLHCDSWNTWQKAFLVCACTHTYTHKHTKDTPCNPCIRLCTNKDASFLWSHMRFSCVSKCYATPLSHISLHFQFHPLFTQLSCVKMRTTQLKSFCDHVATQKRRSGRKKKLSITA